MKSLLMLILLCGAAFLLYPLAARRTASECRALGRETAPAPPPALPRGWPSPAGCALLYWQRMLNPPG